MSPRPRRTLLFVRVKPEASVAARVNGQSLTRIEDAELVADFARDGKLAKDEKVLTWEVPVDSPREGDNTISLAPSGMGSVEVQRIELAVQHGDPDERGYF